MNERLRGLGLWWLLAANRTNATRFTRAEDVMSWIRGVEQGPYFDQAVVGLLYSLRYRNPEQAKELVKGIGDPEFREEGENLIEQASNRVEGR